MLISYHKFFVQEIFKIDFFEAYLKLELQLNQNLALFSMVKAAVSFILIPNVRQNQLRSKN